MNDGTLRRWLDGELGAGEAAAFLDGLSEAERSEAAALARLCAAARSLPAAAPAPDFTRRVLARVATRRAPRRSALTWLVRPAVTPVGALAGAFALALLASGLTAWAVHRGPLAPAAQLATGHAAGELPAARDTRTGGASAAIHGGAAQERVVLARLTLRAPHARQVAVAASFNGWNPAATPMRRGPGGVWTLEVPLEPGRRYEYMFVVDGTWRTDPDAPARVEDGFGGQNAVLDL